MTTPRRSLLTRAVPLHWSSLLGVVSVACLAVLTVTGVVLMFFYDPSSDTVRYDGSYTPLQGVEMSKALASTLHLSLDVPGGLLVRQTHHWAALVLPASLVLQLLTTFFTGAFRRPRQWSWVLLALTFVLVLAAGWSGYALPDDLLAGTGLRIAEGIAVAIPYVGTRAAFLLLGGEFPASVVTRMYWLHVAIVPALLTGVLALRLRLVLRRQPAQFPGPGRTESDVVGLPLRAVAVRAAGLFLVTTGVLVLLAGTVTIDPVWLHGPSSTGQASSGSQPDWYTSFLDGALRLVPPGWEVTGLGGTWSLTVLVPQAVVAVFLAAIIGWPFLEARLTGDRRDHHLLDRPREHPTRTGLGAAGVTFFLVLWLSGSTDVVATQLHISFESQVAALRVVLFAGPLIAFWTTRWLCRSLAGHEREERLEGYETGRILRSPEGGYTEVHRPLPSLRG
ncbi:MULTISPECIES: cytochrome bc1 complex cytochrome b subunit [unclassified Nocardioides]|uniref:cytochrome bc1 complex cytochrome b subunit n=1 Tax=Nocardioides sp. URHA0032 TaxID=1380388 RepID=UPI0009DD9458|nr:cytochrome b N-terminal domain-containing protein [Nocardioides sp. URHA0032]